RADPSRAPPGRSRRCEWARLSLSPGLLLGRFVPLQLVVQRRPVDIENARGLREISTTFADDPFDMGPFDFVERPAQAARLSMQPQREVARPDFMILADYQGTLDGILELPDISGPAMRHQQLHRGLRNVRRLAIGGFAEFAQEIIGEQRDVFAALAQRWHVDGEDVEPV